MMNKIILTNVILGFLLIAAYVFERWAIRSELETLKVKEKLIKVAGASMHIQCLGSGSHKILEKNGVSNICFEDVAVEYLEYVIQFDEKYHSKEHTDAYKSIISDEHRGQLINANRKLMGSIQVGEQLSYKIEASV